MTETFEALQQKAKQAWDAVENPSRTQMFVGWGIHGLAAGAPDVDTALRKALAAKRIQADFHPTGGL
ncbi:MAG: hypothetical protein HY261_10775, partial [Chloroflexi bacterium]|nr:hypothetical protein [Chloroflexota bacterium]